MTLQDFNAGSEVTTALLHELIATVIRLDRTALTKANWPLRAVGPVVLWDNPMDGPLMRIAQDNGSGHAGDDVTQCSFTYTIYKDDGTTVRNHPDGTPATGLTPLKPRAAVGAYAQGSAYIGGIGPYGLVWPVVNGGGNKLCLVEAFEVELAGGVITP